MSAEDLLSLGHPRKHSGTITMASESLARRERYDTVDNIEEIFKLLKQPVSDEGTFAIGDKRYKLSEPLM